MTMPYLLFFSTAFLGLVLIWKNVTGKMPYDRSFGAGLGLLIGGMAVQSIFPEFLFLVPLAMTFLVLVPVVWALDAGSAPVARFVDACLAADNPARERNAGQLLVGLIWIMAILLAATLAYRALPGDFVPAVSDLLIFLLLQFLAVCLARIGIRVFRHFAKISGEEGL